MKTNLNNMNPVLFVVDMVNGFCKEGAMADQNIMHIVKPIQDLCEKVTPENRYFIADTHNVDDIEFSAFPQHCVKGDIESDVIDELKSYIQTPIIEKNSTNAFHAMNDHPALKDPQIDAYIITGCCSDICVLQFALTLKTYLNAQNMDKKVIVPMNAIETYDAPGHDAKQMNEVSYNLMKAAGIIVVEELN